MILARKSLIARARHKTIAVGSSPARAGLQPAVPLLSSTGIKSISEQEKNHAATL